MNKMNFLDYIPQKNVLKWYSENNLVTITKENKGFFNRLFQFLIKKPKYTYIHLDKTGSIIWKHIDGKRKISEFKNFICENQKEENSLAYQRLSLFFKSLMDCNLIKINNKK